MALADNKAKILALLEGINALPEADSGDEGNAGTCVVTVACPQSVPPKYIFNDGWIGYSYIDAQGALRVNEVTGVGSASIGPSSYTFEPTECKCGSMLSVAFGQVPITSVVKSSDEIIGPVGVSESDFRTMVSFILPETPGNYTIEVYTSVDL